MIHVIGHNDFKKKIKLCNENNDIMRMYYRIRTRMNERLESYVRTIQGILVSEIS